MVVVAHRGGRFDVPNSLMGIKKAVNYAQLNPSVPFMIEVDVQQSRSPRRGKSGPLVIIHDYVVNLTTTSKGRVSSFTLEQLQSMSMKPVRKQIPDVELAYQDQRETLLIPITEDDRRIPSLQEVLDVLDTANDHRQTAGIPPIGLGIDFTHVAGRMDRFKDHVVYPFLEKLSPGSQLHKVSIPEELLHQLAAEICASRRKTPIQVISQGVHGRRHLGILKKLVEQSSASVSIAVQASTSLFPADCRDVRASLGLDEAELDQLIKGRKLTINCNHRWDRLAHYLRVLSGGGITDPYSWLPPQIAMSNREAMAAAREEGILTGFWTVNSSAAIRDVIQWGADLVTTDYPPRAVAVIRELAGTAPLNMPEVDVLPNLSPAFPTDKDMEVTDRATALRR